MVIIANKTLINDMGITDFIKGNSYSVMRDFYEPLKISENTTVIDETNNSHRLGIWAKHFKIKK